MKKLILVALTISTLMFSQIHADGSFINWAASNTVGRVGDAAIGVAKLPYTAIKFASKKMYCLTCFTAKKLLLPTNSRPILSGRNAVGASIVAAPIIIWGIGTTARALLDYEYDTYSSFQVG